MSGRRRALTAATSGTKKNGEQEQQADRSELGERFEIEVVDVLDRDSCFAVLVPPDGEATGSGAQPRVAHDVTPGCVPLRAAAVTRQAEQSLIQVLSPTGAELNA